MAEYGVVDEPDDKDEAGSAILEDSREGLKTCIEDESEQRKEMQDDLRFAVLDQWPADLRAQRENDIVNGPRPCLTVDQINQYITQVANDMSANRPSIKARPEDDRADPETAKIFDGRIRHIEDRSQASVAYQTSGDSAVTIGLGFFRIVTDYVSPESFEQELLIKRIPDTFCVYLSSHVMPDGSDAEKGWVFEKVPLAKFKREYPGKKVADQDFAGLGVLPTWKTSDDIIVCEYFYKQYAKKKLLFLEDGTTMFQDKYDEFPGAKPQVTGERDSQEVTVQWCKHTGCEVLDKRTLKGKYIPIIEEVGKEKIVDGKRMLWGLVRPAKDSLRAYNYWISAMTEKMALAPKAPFVGAVGQFATQGEKWDKANVNNYAKLEYDAIDVNGTPVAAPRRQEPMQMEPAMVQMMTIHQNNVKSSLGMYKASIGDTESQQSGRAILALKKESDTGTSHFGANQAISVAHCGRILVDLIPYYTDTKQIIKIIGEDGKEQSIAIDPQQKEAMREVRGLDGKVKRIFNLAVGKYGITVTVGPGYTTSRQEAATVMTELANSAKDPISAAIMRYGAVKNSDFHGSEEIMRMLKAMLPPQVKPPEDGQEPMPPEAMQKIMQLTQQLQLLQQEGQKVSQENAQLKSGAQEGMAKVAADHDTKMKALALDEAVAKEKARISREQFEFEKQLEIDKGNHEIDLDERKAAADNKIASDKLVFEQQCAERKLSQEEEAKAADQSEAMEPKFLEEISQSLKELTAALIAAQSAPRQVSIGNVKRTDGKITGATVNTTIQ